MKRQTEPQPIERPVLHRKGRTDEAAQNPSDLARCAPARLDEAARHPLARPKLRPASQIAIWMSIDIISAAELRLIALGEPPPVINRCELRQLPWHGKGRQSPAPATGRTAPLDLRRPLRYGKRNHSTLGCWMVKKRSPVPPPTPSPKNQQITYIGTMVSGPERASAVWGNRSRPPARRACSARPCLGISSLCGRS